MASEAVAALPALPTCDDCGGEGLDEKGERCATCGGDGEVCPHCHTGLCAKWERGPLLCSFTGEVIQP